MLYLHNSGIIWNEAYAIDVDIEWLLISGWLGVGGGSIGFVGNP